MALLHGFCFPLSANPGQRIEFRISTTADVYSVTILRFRNRGTDEVSVEDINARRELIEERVLDTFILPGREQPIRRPDESWLDWDRAFMIDITDEWNSGLYAAKCEDDDGTVFYVLFIVKSNPERRKPILVLANASTWNAYNDMGGFSRYSVDPAAEGKPADQPYQLTYYRPNLNFFTDLFQSKHLARAEVWFLNWLEQAGFEFDLTCDIDLHFGEANLEHYAAVIMHTHPEYWSTEMIDYISSYLDQGGNLLYLGGNGVFDRIEISSDGLFMTVFGNSFSSSGEPEKRPQLFRKIDRTESLLLGIRTPLPYDPVGHSKPYTVTSVTHRFFKDVLLPDGSTITDGSLIGTRGWNIEMGAVDLEGGAASGWEMDAVDADNSPPGLEILAADVRSDHAQMVYYPHPGGGFVFSTGSIRFGGSVVVDVSLQQIVSNALNAAILQ